MRNPTLQNLLLTLYSTAKKHHEAGALYYASLEQSDLETNFDAVEQYKYSGEQYLTILNSCEQLLLSMDRDEELGKELKRIQTLIHSVNVVLKYL